MPAINHKPAVKTAIFSLLLVTLAVVANGAMDTISFRYDRSLLAKYPALRQWADPATAWKNKWKNGDPTQGEAFPFSSTALVGTTDAWHLLKGLMLLCLVTAIVLPFTHLFSLHWTAWVGILLSVKFVFSCAFESQFGWLLLR